MALVRRFIETLQLVPAAFPHQLVKPGQQRIYLRIAVLNTLGTVNVATVPMSAANGGMVVSNNVGYVEFIKRDHDPLQWQQWYGWTSGGTGTPYCVTHEVFEEDTAPGNMGLLLPRGFSITDTQQLSDARAVKLREQIDRAWQRVRNGIH